MKKKIGKAVGAIVLIVALVILGNSAFVIKENQYGLIREF